MLNLVNFERSEAGISTLQLTPRLMEAAWLKAEDVVNHNYFSHTSPIWGSPFAMHDSLGVAYRSIAENIVGKQFGGSCSSSPDEFKGHRNNILKASFTSVGIGISESAVYGYVFVQIFTESLRNDQMDMRI
jgi:uncharacterized protein YkwD